MNALSRLAGACWLALALAGCATSHQQKPTSTAVVAPAPDAGAGAAAPDCTGCELRGDQCMEHLEGEPPRDGDGNPLAPTEGFDFQCAAECCGS